MSAPVNWLQILEDIALLIHFAEYTDFLCFKGRAHGEIAVFPVTENTETLEGSFVKLHEILREILTLASEFGYCHLVAVELRLLDDCRFNGHTVVIPARNERNLEAAHGLGFVYDILEYLVECVTHVDVAV